MRNVAIRRTYRDQWSQYAYELFQCNTSEYLIVACEAFSSCVGHESSLLNG